MKKSAFLLGALALAATACEPPTPTTITVTPATATLAALAETVQLTAVVEDENGNPMPDVTVTWSSNKAGVASVADGLVTAEANGATVVTASAEGLSAKAEITVRQTVVTVAVKPDGVDLGPPPIRDTVTLTSDARDGNDHPVEDATATWASSDTSVATVDDNGFVTSLFDGTATVTATAGGVSGAASIVVDHQRGALVAIYDATGGDGWTKNDGWGTTRPLSDWHGVGVDAGKVMSLDLRDNNLTGSLPPEIAGLGRVRQLDLGGNRIGGRIPAEIRYLKELRLAYLSQNQLEGELPPELSQLRSIRDLRLSTNLLEGSIPPELGQLDSLFHFAAIGNSFEGEIPSAIAQAPSLKVLLLADNDLTGEIPPEIGDMAKLSVLSLHSNDLTGEIPPEIGDMNDLEEVYLYGNKLTWRVPEEIADGKIAILEMHDNELEGPLPLSMKEMSLTKFTWYGQNGLCAPDDKDFRDWMANIPSHEPGPKCEDSGNRENFDSAGALDDWEKSENTQAAVSRGMLRLNSDEGEGRYEVSKELDTPIDSGWLASTKMGVEWHDEDAACANLLVFTGDSVYTTWEFNISYDGEEDWELMWWALRIRTDDKPDWGYVIESGYHDYLVGTMNETEMSLRGDTVRVYVDGDLLVENNLAGNMPKNDGDDPPPAMTKIGLGHMKCQFFAKVPSLFDWVEVQEGS